MFGFEVHHVRWSISTGQGIGHFIHGCDCLQDHLIQVLHKSDNLTAVKNESYEYRTRPRSDPNRPMRLSAVRLLVIFLRTATGLLPPAFFGKVLELEKSSWPKNKYKKAL